MTAQAELHTLAVKVGEISGQLRELIHSSNNMAQKIDGLTERILTAPTAADFEKLSARVTALGDFVTGVSFSGNNQGVIISAVVRAADSVGIRLQNETGADVTLPAGTFYLTGRKR